MRDHLASEQGSKRAPPAAPPPTVVFPQARAECLELQRVAGNRATMALVQRQQAPNSTPALPVNSPFYVSFTHDPPPATPDHSRRSPGPTGDGADRAGHTLARLSKRMTIRWDTGDPGADGRLPMFAQSVNVFYTLRLSVGVSSDYAVGSCPYRVTLAHEKSHAIAFIRISRESRDALISELGTVDVPTRNRPAFVAPDEAGARQEEIGRALSRVVLEHSRQVVRTMTTDRESRDSPSAYRAVYSQCPARQW